MSNPILNLTEYELHHLADHLESSRRANDLHHLLALETSEYHNAWYDAKEAVADTSGYLIDVKRAWRLADEPYVLGKGESKGRNLGLQIRYALIVASLNSLIENIPSALLLALVEKGQWTPIQGFTYAKRLSIPNAQAEALVGLIPYLHESLLHDVLLTIQAIDDKYSREFALSEVAVQLAKRGNLDDALAAAHGIENEEERTKALAHIPLLLIKSGYPEKSLTAARRVGSLVDIIPYLSQNLFQEALTTAREIEADWGRCVALASLASRMAEIGYTEKALAVIQEIDWEGVRAEALAKIAPQLSEKLLEQALAAARKIGWENARAEALAGLIPYLPEKLAVMIQTESLTTIRSIEDLRTRAHALINLILLVPEENKAIVLVDTQRITRNICDELAMDLDSADVTCHLDASWAKTLVSLILYLPESERDFALSQALAVARKVEYGIDRVETLIDVATHLPESERVLALRDALATVRGMNRSSFPFDLGLERAWSSLAPKLPENLMQEALMVVREIRYLPIQAKVLVCLLPYLSMVDRVEILDETLTSLREEIQNKSQYFGVIEAITILAPHLPVDLLEKTLLLVGEFQQTDDRGDAIKNIAPYLPETLLREALKLVKKGSSNDETRQALVLISLRLAELGNITEALEEAQRMTRDNYRADTLDHLAPYLSKGLLFEALKDAREKIEDQYLRFIALDGLAKQASKLNLHEKMLAILQKIADEKDQAEALASLPRCLANLDYSEEALAVLQQIKDEETQNLALVRIAVSDKACTTLAPLLPKVFLRKILRFVGIVLFKSQKEEHVFANLLCRLAELGYPARSLVMARKYSKKFSPPIHVEALIRLTPYLSDNQFQYVWTMVQNINDSGPAARVIVGLAPHLPRSLLPDALSLSGKLRYPDRVKALVGLLPYLPESLKGNALDDAIAAEQKIYEYFEKAEALNMLAPYLPDTYKVDLVRKIFAGVSSLDSHQEEIMRWIAPHMSESMLHNALDVGYLAELVPYLSETLLYKALALVKEIEHEPIRVMDLISLLSYLPDSLLYEALTTAHEIKDQANRARVYAKIIPSLSESEREIIIDEVLAIVQEINQRTRLEILVSVVPYLSELEYVKILKEAFALATEGAHAANDYGYLKNDGTEALEYLMRVRIAMGNRTTDNTFRVWQENLLNIAGRTRKDLLLSLCAIVPAIATMGGSAAVEEMTQAIQDVGRWWP